VSDKELIAILEEENKCLKQELATLKKLIFGHKTERYKAAKNDAQLSLFADEKVEEVPEEKETISYTRKKRKNHPGRNKIPDHLPVEEIIIEPEENVEGLRRIGEEITESLKYTKASLIKKRVIRPKYEKTDKEGVIIADLPPKAMHKCIAEPSLIAYILSSKFVYHLPFYRILKKFKREYDLVLSPSTINNWFTISSELLEPIYAEMVKQVQQSTYLQADESPIKVLESEKKNKSHQGYQWVYHAPQEKLVVFHYRKGRGQQGPKEFLKNYKGILQCDGYQVYDKIGLRPEIELIGCLAHARRYFYSALDNDKKRSKFALDRIQKIYAIERKWKDPTEEVSQEQRKKKIKALLNELKNWCEEESIRVLPKSSIGKAIGYYQKQYHKLIDIANHSYTEIDNNLIENKIRPLALGRKNYLFAGSHKSAQRIAMMYSFFATCELRGKDPSTWLEQTLEALAYPNVNIQDLIP